MITSLAERRATVREAVVVNRICMEWWEGEDIRRAEGRMLDISGGGALVAIADRPPIGQTVWFHLETPAPTDEVSAVVVRHGRANEIGLAFCRPCPYDLHLAAVLGVNPCGFLSDY